MSDIVNSSTNTIVGILISVILICSALIPVVVDQLTKLNTDYATKASALGLDMNTWISLLGVVVVIVIVGMVVLIVRGYNRTEQD